LAGCFDEGKLAKLSGFLGPKTNRGISTIFGVVPKALEDLEKWRDLSELPRHPRPEIARKKEMKVKNRMNRKLARARAQGDTDPINTDAGSN